MRKIGGSKMIDNFELIKPLFYFNEANDMFFHCQIVQRAKDHKGQKVKEGAIKTYFIRSREHLDRVKGEIKLLCEHYGARAYINVAGKDFKSLQDLLLAKLAEYNLSNTVRDPRRILNSMAGELKSRRPKWIVDVDDEAMKEPIYKWLKSLGWGDYQIVEIPTKQCCHFIVSKFNTQDFHETFPDVDVHKNSMGTLLYYPDVLDRPRYCCSECGGTNVQTQAWVDSNTNEYIEDITEDDECWCEDCMKHTKLREV